MRAVNLILIFLFLVVPSHAAFTVRGEPELEVSADGTLTAIFLDVEVDNYGVYRIAVTDDEVRFNFNVNEDLTAASKQAIRAKFKEKIAALRNTIQAKRTREQQEESERAIKRSKISLPVDSGDIN